MRLSVRGTPLAAVALTLVLGAQGCGTHPDTALTVGERGVSLSQVDADVDALCAPEAAEVVGGELPRAEIRSVVAGLHATAALLEEFRASHGISESAAEATTLHQITRELRARDIERPEELARLLTVGDWYSSTLVQSAARALSPGADQAGPVDPQQTEAAFGLGQETFTRWLGTQEVTFDPRLHLDGARVAPAAQGVNPLSFGPLDTGSTAISPVATQALRGESPPSVRPETICGTAH